MIAYMKDVSHTVLIMSNPGVIDLETDKNMKTNGAGVYYLPEHTLKKQNIDALECSHLICYDTDIPVEGFEPAVYIVFSAQELSINNVDRHLPLFVIMAEDVVSSDSVVDIVTTVPLKYRDTFKNKEAVNDETTTTPLVVRREPKLVTDMSVLAISVKRMIRGLI